MRFSGVSKILILIIFCCLGPGATSQQSSFFFEESGQYTALDVLLIMESQGASVVYSADKLPAHQVRISAGSYPLKEINEFLASIGGQLVTSGNDLLFIEVKPETFTVAGFVRDEASGEALIGASIEVMGANTGVISNPYGYFSLLLTAGPHIIKTSYIGYQSQIDTLMVRKNMTLDPRLGAKPVRLQMVQIDNYALLNSIEEKPPGSHRLIYRNKGSIPYFMGEVDILQEALLLPGITSLGEDASGINIRGGNVDQNLYLLDEATIYNPNHFYGLISVFNPEAISDMQVMKGYIPPAYGGRASSVLSIYQREGNYQDLKVSGGIGLVSARATVEGPLKKGKASFLVSGRQSLVDISQINQAGSNRRNRTTFQDFNLKVNYKANNKNTFYLSGYVGNDRNRAGFDAVRRWGNNAATLRWNHTFGPRLFSNISATISEYNYRISNPIEAGSFIGRSSIINYSLKADNFYNLNSNTNLNFGISAIFHQLQPGERVPFDENSSQNEPLIIDTEHGLETGIYADAETDVGPLKLNYGLRISNFIALGAAERYRYREGEPISNENIVDTARYDKWEGYYYYTGLEPRIAASLRLLPNIYIKSSYNRNIQYLHLISNTAAPSPTDIWKLTDDRILPVITDQVSTGVFSRLGKSWEVSLEAYYKRIANLIDYKDGADLLFNANIETELLAGNGRAYGAEVFIKKNAGRLTGWLSYTLARAERAVDGQFEEQKINDGEFYPEDFDKTHDLSLLTIFKVNQRLSLSGSFNFSTGRPFTFPSGKYFFNNTLVPHFEGRNQNRLPNYHRLDVSAKLLGRQTRKNGKERKLNDYWTFSLYNVYARNNVYSYFFRQSNDVPAVTEIEEFSIFSTIIPAITYNFKF